MLFTHFVFGHLAIAMPYVTIHAPSTGCCRSVFPESNLPFEKHFRFLFGALCSKEGMDEL
jgi:hypothetical protein